MIGGRHLTPGVPLASRVAGLRRGLHRRAKGLRVLPVGKLAIREAMACPISLQIAHEGVEPLADCLMHCYGVWLGLTRLGLRHRYLLLGSASGLLAPSPSALVLDQVDASVRRSSPRTLSQRSCDILRSVRGPPIQAR